MSSAQRERIFEVLEIIGLKDRAETKAGNLAHGQKQWLEIGMLLAQNAQLLLVDEPAAGMTDEETAKMGIFFSVWLGSIRSLSSSTTWFSFVSSEKGHGFAPGTRSLRWNARPGAK